MAIEKLKVNYKVQK